MVTQLGRERATIAITLLSISLALPDAHLGPLTAGRVRGRQAASTSSGRPVPALAVRRGRRFLPALASQQRGRQPDGAR